jgi:hypothetical protein
MVKACIAIVTALVVVAGVAVIDVGAYDIDLQQWLKQAKQETTCPKVEGIKWAMSVAKESQTCQSILRMLALRSQERQAKAFAPASEANAAIRFPYGRVEIFIARKAVGPLADALLRDGRTQFSME